MAANKSSGLSFFRKKVVDILSTILFKTDDPKKAEELLYDQAIQFAEMFGKSGKLIEIYKKYAYERLGELMSIPIEKRMDYIIKEGMNRICYGIQKLI